MNNDIQKIEQKIMKVIENRGNIPLTSLESEVASSTNLFFLALDNLTRKNKIFLQKKGYDYEASLSISFLNIANC